MSSDRPDISLVVIAYNGMEFLPDCLRTLINAARPLRHEVIVIDNGSTDGSLEYIRSDYPSITLVENGANLGFAKAVNIGFEHTTGKYVCILNQDLRFHPETFTRLLERIKQSPDIGMIGPRYNGFDGHLQHSARAFPAYRHVLYAALLLDKFFPRHREFSSWRMGWFEHMTEMFVDQPMGAVMLMPRSVIDRVGPMDESFPLFGNDVDYCRRMAQAGFKRLYFPEAVVEHFVGGSTRKRPVRLKITAHRSLYRYLKKYARPLQFPLLWLCGLLLLIGLLPNIIAAIFTRRS